MRRKLLFASFVLVACGSRTDLLSAAGGPQGSNASCANADRPWLLFELDSLDGAQVYAMRSDGTDGHTLPLAHKGPIFASISGDGTKLLYVSFEGDTDGGDEGTLYIDDLASGTTTPILSGQSPSYSSLSADGTSVAYTLGYDLHIVNVNGTNDRILLQQPPNIGWGYGHPVFLGTSSTILYGFGGAFGSINADGSNSQTLVVEGLGDLDYPNPSPSPDLASVAAVTECSDDTQWWLRVYSYASLPSSCDSGTKVTATEGFSSAPNESANPAWGPTGLIAYGDGTDVYVVDPSNASNGSAVPKNMTSSLTGASGTAFDPLWASGCAPMP